MVEGKHSETEPAERLAEPETLNTVAMLFRERGYEGTSLSLIMRQTGLSKASLYLRFPGGKQDMAIKVLQQASRVFADDLLVPLSEGGDLQKRLKRTTARIREFYEAGKRPCLIDTMTLCFSEDSEVRAAARSGLEYWIGQFTDFAAESFPNRGAARRTAERAVAAIEGGLILSRALGTPQPFANALADLPGYLINPDAGQQASS